MRVAGGTARNYVEGATTGCSASGNAAKHIPALYYFGTYTDGTGTHNDHDFCNTEVRPYSEFDVNNLPTYAFITPTLCNDGHDCNDATVDAWAPTNIQRVLDSAAYKAGTVAVFVWYDEDHPVPNVADRAHLAQGQHHPDRRRIARRAAEDDRGPARAAVHEPGPAARRDGPAQHARDVAAGEGLRYPGSPALCAPTSRPSSSPPIAVSPRGPKPHWPSKRAGLRKVPNSMSTSGNSE